MAGGIGNRMVNNTFYNFDAPLVDQFNYVFNPASVITDFVVGGAAASIMNGIVRGIDYVKNKSSGTAGVDVQFEQALKTLDKSGLRPGQTQISKGRVMEIYNNYDLLKAQSSVYSSSTGRYLVDGHHTTVAISMLGRGTSMNMNMATNLPPSATNIYWHKLVRILERGHRNYTLERIIWRKYQLMGNYFISDLMLKNADVRVKGFGNFGIKQF